MLIELRSTCPFPIVAVIIVYIFFAKISEWPFVVRFPHLFSGCCTGHCPGCGVINIYIFFKDFRVAICTMVFTSVFGLLLWPLCSVVFNHSRFSLSIRHSFYLWLLLALYPCMSVLSFSILQTGGSWLCGKFITSKLDFCAMCVYSFPSSESLSVIPLCEPVCYSFKRACSGGRENIIWEVKFRYFFERACPLSFRRA